MMEIPNYITVSLPFHCDGDVAKLILSTAWLSKICAHRIIKLVKENLALIDLSEYSFLKKFRQYCYDILPNRRYVDGILKLIWSTLQSAKQLGVNIRDLELSSWLLFQSDGEKGYAKGNINIRLTTLNKVRILTFNYNHEKQYIELNVTTPKGYRRLLEKLIHEANIGNIGYPARVYITDYGIGKCGFHVVGKVQVMIPFNLYVDVMRRYEKPLSDLVAGIDVNVDRIDIAVLSPLGTLKLVRTFSLKEATFMGVRRERARSIIGEIIHKMLKWLYHCGISTIVLENPKVIGYLRYYWIKNGERRGSKWNWKVSMFRNRLIQYISWKAILYGIDIRYVSPKGTTHSKLHDEIMRKYKVDKHTASAIVIALKGLKQT